MFAMDLRMDETGVLSGKRAMWSLTTGRPGGDIPAGGKNKDLAH